MNNIFSLTSPDELQARADHGEAEAQYRLAKKIFNQESTHLDHSLAAKYFKMAADQNHPRGLNGYGACLEFGIGVEADMKKAAQYYAAAAAQGDPLGQMNYAICLKNGFGIPKYNEPIKDDKQVINYEKILEELHQADLEKIREESMDTYERNMHRLNVSLMDPNSLDSSMVSSRKKSPFPIPIPIDPDEDVDSTKPTTRVPSSSVSSSSRHRRDNRSSHELNSLLSKNNISDQEKEIKSQPPTAFFKYAADNGEVDAESIYGRCLLRGEYNNRDIKNAEKYLQMAVKQGDTDAKRCFLYYSTISERTSSSLIKLPKVIQDSSKNAKSNRSRSVIRQIFKR